VSKLDELNAEYARNMKALENHEEAGYTDEEWHTITKLKGMVKGLELAVDIMGGKDDDD